MLKFLRRYNKWILVVGGSLLMIAFLVPGAIQQFGKNPANTTVLRVNGQRVTAKEFDQARREHYALMAVTSGLLPMMGVEDGVEHWLLLRDMAERGGYVGGALEGRTYLRAIARGMVDVQFGSLATNPQFAQFYQQQVQQRIDALNSSLGEIAARASLTEEEVELALAKLRGVRRLEDTWVRAARVSEPRVLIEAKKQLDKAVVDYVFLPADRALAGVAEPDDTALEAQLERFKDLKPGEGEFGIGYLLPARIKLEYLTIDRAKLLEKIQPDLKDLKKRFAAGNTGGVTDETFEQARPRLEQTLKGELADRVLREADRAIRTEVAKATRKLESDGAFKVLPQNWAAQRPSLASMVDAMVQHVQRETQVTIDPPTVAVLDESWQTPTELAELPGIGKSNHHRGRQQDPFADYALSVKELKPDTALPMQVGLPVAEPTTDGTGSVYYFTVLDARKEGAPATASEERARLARDWKRLRAFESLKNDAEKLRAEAIAGGLTSFEEARAPTVPGKQSPLRIGSDVMRTRLVPDNPAVNSEELRLAIIAAVEKLDPKVKMETIPVDQRTLAIPLPSKLGVAVVLIKNNIPLTTEQFRTQEGRIASQLQMEEARETKDNPFSLKNLRERMNVRSPDGKKLTEVDRTEG